MSLHTKPHLLWQLLMFILLARKASPQPKPGCPKNCGSLSIPYPFGITQECSLDNSFLITCQHNNSSNSSIPTPLLTPSNVTVLNISLNGELRISTQVAYDCYNKAGHPTSGNYRWFELPPHFKVSSGKNKVTGIGCDTVGLIIGWDSQGANFTTGCLSLCFKPDDIVSNGSCNGIGCCEAPLPPQGLSLGSASASVSVLNHTRVHDFNPCGYSFLAEQGAYSFSSLDLMNNFQDRTFDAVVDWAVGNKSCQEAKRDLNSFACVAQHSECVESNNGIGYLCNCSHGFRGNPYLINGCQDINECVESNPCNENATCLNTVGSFECSCHEGYEGDGLRNNGIGCHLKVNGNSGKNTVLVTTLCVTISVLGLLAGSIYIYWAMKKRKLIKWREKFFLQNGGILLQEQIARNGGSSETAKIFTIEELKSATNNFDEGKVLGQGGHGTVYKGVLPNGIVVAIKKSKICDHNEIEQFINEIIVLSQINHRNVLKLLGCCLDTEVPLLVYEFITNGTLSNHLHDQTLSYKLSWKMRLRIATETAGALSYLHSATSTPIIHRDVKTMNILLDHNLTAKISDFGASRLIPLDQTQITTLVQGTFGYLDPEYFQTSQLTEKSDVYSFGVVLAELLTSMKALCFDRHESQRNLSMYFVSSMKEGFLLQMVDKQIMEQENVEQIVEVANIAERCLRVKGEDRPSMKQVAMELEGLRNITEKHPWGSVNVSSEENEYLLLNPISHACVAYIGDDGNGATAGIESINQISVSLECGR